jgi:hypothetical protein
MFDSKCAAHYLLEYGLSLNASNARSIAPEFATRKIVLGITDLLAYIFRCLAQF